MQHFRTILQQLCKTNLSVKSQKCQLGMAECVYLGHVIGREWYDQSYPKWKQYKNLVSQPQRNK